MICDRPPRAPSCVKCAGPDRSRPRRRANKLGGCGRAKKLLAGAGGADHADTARQPSSRPLQPEGQLGRGGGGPFCRPAPAPAVAGEPHLHICLTIVALRSKRPRHSSPCCAQVRPTRWSNRLMEPVDGRGYSRPVAAALDRQQPEGGAQLGSATRAPDGRSWALRRFWAPQPRCGQFTVAAVRGRQRTASFGAGSGLRGALPGRSATPPQSRPLWPSRRCAQRLNGRYA